MKLSQAYVHVDDVDLFAGGFMENQGSSCGDGFSGPEQCGILGPTFRCIVGDTFLGLKFGVEFLGLNSYGLNCPSYFVCMPNQHVHKKDNLAQHRDGYLCTILLVFLSICKCALDLLLETSA